MMMARQSSLHCSLPFAFGHCTDTDTQRCPYPLIVYGTIFFKDGSAISTTESPSYLDQAQPNTPIKHDHAGHVTKHNPYLRGNSIPLGNPLVGVSTLLPLSPFVNMHVAAKGRWRWPSVCLLIGGGCMAGQHGRVA